jgi:hypothetical protein
MTTTRFTKEQLIARIETQKETALKHPESSIALMDLQIAEVALASLTAEPTVTFYRDGIEAAATWVDQQRESYDNEHGRHDPDTGMFEFGNDAQRDYSATLEEIAEGIRGLHPNTAPPAPVVPDEKPMPKASNMFAIDAVAAIAEAMGWNACRAAMLQGSQPVSNRDELPVSEIECDICGFKSTDPDGAHYCCEDNSND